MKKLLLLSQLFLIFTTFSQEGERYKYDGYFNKSKAKVELLVSFEIDSTSLQISYYSTVNENTKLLKWDSFTIDSSGCLVNDSIKSIYCRPFQFNFITSADGSMVIEQFYFNKVIRSFHNEKEFEVTNSKSDFSVSNNPLLLIQNPQFDYLIKGKSNTVTFMQNGVPVANLIVVSDDCKIDAKYGTARISEFTDSIVELKLVDKLDATVYLTKSFFVRDKREMLTIEDNYINVEFFGGDIATGHARKLMLSQVNILYLVNWENIKKDIKIELENATKISYKNGLLALVPNGEGLVRVTIYEEEKGQMLVSTQFRIE